MKIELKQWRQHEEDKEALIRICNDVRLRSYIRNRLPFPYMMEDAEWFIGHAMEEDGKTGIYRAVVVDDVYVGNISVEQRDDVYCKSAELGYMLDYAYWSKGIMTKAAGMACDLGFSQLDIVRIEGSVCEPNIGSRRVLEKNGFKLEGTLKKAVYKNGEYYDYCIYGLVR